MVLPLRDTALFLDVDGTLLEIQDQPDAVISNPQLTDLLTALAQRLGGALALVSGRPIDEIDRIFAPEVFCAAGGHGVQLRLPDGSLETHPTRLPASTVQLLQDGLMGHAGTFLERKSHGLALHYRANPQAADAVRQLADGALEDLNRRGEQFELLSGKMVFELVPQDVNKGGAINRLMQHPVFAHRAPVFVGDDVTDEYGFSAVNSLGGQSLKVGPGDTPTAARELLEDVAAVHRWLSGLLEQAA